MVTLHGYGVVQEGIIGPDVRRDLVPLGKAARVIDVIRLTVSRPRTRIVTFWQIRKFMSESHLLLTDSIGVRPVCFDRGNLIRLVARFNPQVLRVVKRALL